jgi:hypothetical protein
LTEGVSGVLSPDINFCLLLLVKPKLKPILDLKNLKKIEIWKVWIEIGNNLAEILKNICRKKNIIVKEFWMIYLFVTSFIAEKRNNFK